jgi:hypothetical protein
MQQSAVDVVKYWKTQCDQAEQDRLALEDELEQVKSQLEKLKQAGRTTAKRRIDTGLAPKANTQSKRRKLGPASADDSDDETEEEVHRRDPGKASFLKLCLRLTFPCRC